MASVKKSPSRGSKYWVACYTLPNGKQVQKSTGLEDKDLAYIQAQKLEYAAKLAKRGGLNREKAINLINEIAEAAERPVLGKVSVIVFLNSFLDSTKGSTAESTYKRRGPFVTRFVAFLGNDSSIMVSDVQKESVVSFRNACKNQGLAGKTINDCLVFLKSAFDDAVQQGLAIENPVEGVKPPSKKPTGKRKPFTTKQLSELVEKSAFIAPLGEWPDFISIGYFTGQRQQDCAKLKVNQINFVRGSILFSRKKNNDDHDVPIHPALELILRRLVEGKESYDYIMPGIACLPPTGNRSISDIFRDKILPLIGVVQLLRKGVGSSRKINPYSYHSLRHTFNNSLNEAGASDEDRMRIVGHDDKEVSRGYTHVQLEHAQKVVARIPSI